MRVNIVKDEKIHEDDSRGVVVSKLVVPWSILKQSHPYSTVYLLSLHVGTLKAHAPVMVFNFFSLLTVLEGSVRIVDTVALQLTNLLRSSE